MDVHLKLKTMKKLLKEQLKEVKGGARRRAKKRKCGLRKRRTGG